MQWRYAHVWSVAASLKFPHKIKHYRTIKNNGINDQTGFRLLLQVRLETKNKNKKRIWSYTVDTGCITMLRLCRLCNYGLKMDKYRPGVTPNSNKKPKSSTKMTYQPSQTPLKSTLTPFLNAERTLKKNVVLANGGQRDN